MYNYVYLLREREFINLNADIYKIGKTCQDNLKRFNQYPKGSELILHIECDDCSKCEFELIQVFNAKYKRRADIGLEYFEGNKDQMKFDIIQLTMRDIFNNTDIKPKSENANENANENVNVNKNVNVNENVNEYINENVNDAVINIRNSIISAPRNRAYIFHINNITNSDWKMIEKLKFHASVHYMCACIDNMSINGLIRFKHAKSLSSAKSLFNNKTILSAETRNDNFYASLCHGKDNFFEHGKIK
jgi:hypothetical protein